MAISSYPPVTFKRTVVTLTSGTSWTVPTGVTFVNVTLVGGGGGGSVGSSSFNQPTSYGLGGQVIASNVSTTPGASITYAIGAAGAAGTSASGGAGGTTTFTGATSATGGNGGGTSTGAAGQTGAMATNYGAPGLFQSNGGAGGAGKIEIEYWV